MSDEYISMRIFMERTEMGEWAAKAIFKNSHLVRRGILVKQTSPQKRGGWRIHWAKYQKWAQHNAADALGIIL